MLLSSCQKNNRKRQNLSKSLSSKTAIGSTTFLTTRRFIHFRQKISTTFKIHTSGNEAPLQCTWIKTLNLCQTFKTVNSKLIDNSRWILPCLFRPQQDLQLLETFSEKFETLMFRYIFGAVPWTWFYFHTHPITTSSFFLNFLTIFTCGTQVL